MHKCAVNFLIKAITFNRYLDFKVKICETSAIYVKHLITIFLQQPNRQISINYHQACFANKQREQVNNNISILTQASP